MIVLLAAVQFLSGWSPLAMAALAALVGVLVCIFLGKLRRGMGGLPGAALVAARLAVLLFLLLALFKPVYSARREAGRKPGLLVVADDSRSMSIKDGYQGKPRIEGLKTVLLGDEGILKGLRRDSAVRVVALSGPEKALGDDEIRALQPLGETTDIDGGLSAALRALSESPAAILLLSDGSDRRGEPLEAFGAPIPVFSVGFGSAEEGERAPRDLVLRGLRADEIARTGSAADLEVEILGKGRRAPGEAEIGRVELFEGKDLLASAEIPLPERGQIASAVLVFRPAEEGFRTYRVEVKPLETEVTAENNSRAFAVQVLGKKIQAIYLEGVLRLEYKYLKGALEKDPGIDLMSLVLTSRDQIYQQGGDAAQGFPSSLAGMRRYDCILLGDVPPAFFTAEQLADLRRYVSEEGGGMALIGGFNSFGEAEWARTPLEGLLPFVLGDRGAGHVNAPLAMLLTPEGRNHPIFQGCQRYFEARGESGLPLLEGANRPARLKPGAALLATGAGPRESGIPLLAVARLGEGRVAGLTADTTWKWYLKMKGLGLESPFNRFWGQLVRWAARREKLTPDEEEPLVLRTPKRNYGSAEEVEIAAERLRFDSGGKVDPTAPDSIPLRVYRKRNGGDLEPLPGPEPQLRRVPGERLIYRGALPPPPPGSYEIAASAPGPPAAGGEPGKKSLEARARFLVGGAPEEFIESDLNRAGLMALAERTGGKYFSHLQAPSIPEALEVSRERALPVVEVRPWEEWPFLAGFLALLTAEWAFRKKRLLIALLFGCALSLGPAGLARPSEPESPPAVQGKIAFSDGRILQGAVYLAEDDVLRLFDEGKKIHRKLRLEDVAGIEVQVSAQEMLRPWRFKEEGSPEKIFYGNPYPRQEYRAQVRLTQGGTAKGNLQGVLFLRSKEGKREKIVFRGFERGKEGEILDDLVYPREVRLEVSVKGGGNIRIVCPKEVRAARAVNLLEGTVAEAAAAGPGGFEAAGLTAGTYSIVLELPGKLMVGLRRDSLDPAVREGVDKLAAEAPDFFDAREVLARHGSGAADEAPVAVLMDLRRHARSTSFETGDRTFRQVTVWTMMKTDKRWIIEDRIILFREAIADRPGGAPGGATAVEFDGRLCDIVLEPGKTKEIVIEGMVKP